MLITTKAIVFSTLKYGEADLIVKCFTEESGLTSYLLRGVLKSRKGKLRSSLFQPLTQLEIVANHKGKGTLENMREAKVAIPYQSLHVDVVKSSVVFFLAEMLRNSIKEEESNPALFAFLESAFIYFDQQETFANFHLLFLLKLTRYLGFYPDHSSVDKPYFNMLDGVFQEINTNPYCIEDENANLLAQFLKIDFEEITSIKLNKNTRKSFLEFVLAYYQIHLESFKKPKSLAVLNEIFQ